MAKLINNKFGPNFMGHYYVPTYHSKISRRNEHKTRWVINSAEEYDVFNFADILDPNSQDTIYNRRWLNSDNKGICSVVDGGNKVLGENGELFAYFPVPANECDPWHGYPCYGEKICKELRDYWNTECIITKRVYRKLMKGEI
jgi:hypothetical protein